MWDFCQGSCFPAKMGAQTTMLALLPCAGNSWILNSALILPQFCVFGSKLHDYFDKLEWSQQPWILLPPPLNLPTEASRFLTRHKTHTGSQETISMSFSVPKIPHMFVKQIRENTNAALCQNCSQATLPHQKGQVVCAQFLGLLWFRSPKNNHRLLTACPVNHVFTTTRGPRCLPATSGVDQAPQRPLLGTRAEAATTPSHWLGVPAGPGSGAPRSVACWSASPNLRSKENKNPV